MATDTKEQDQRPVMTDTEVSVLLTRAELARKQHKARGPLYRRATNIRAEQIRAENEASNDVGSLIHELHSVIAQLSEWRMRFKYADLICREETKIAVAAAALLALHEEIKISNGEKR